MLDSRHTLPDGAQLELLELTRSTVGHVSCCMGASCVLGCYCKPESRAEDIYKSPAIMLGPAYLTSGIYLGHQPQGLEALLAHLCFHPSRSHLQPMKCLEGPKQGQEAS